MDYFNDYYRENITLYISRDDLPESIISEGTKEYHNCGLPQHEPFVLEISVEDNRN